MFLTGEAGQEGEEATLTSHHMELYEGFTKCVTFWFWLEVGETSGVRSLAVFTEDTGGHIVSPWHYNQSTPAWTQGQAGAVPAAVIALVAGLPRGGVVWGG